MQLYQSPNIGHLQTESGGVTPFPVYRWGYGVVIPFLQNYLKKFLDGMIIPLLHKQKNFKKFFSFEITD